MTRSELIMAIKSRVSSFPLSDVEMVVSELLEAMRAAIVRGDRVEVRGFGSFDFKERSPRKARNPKTGEALFVGARRMVYFKPGKELRERVDRATQEHATRETA